MTELVIPRGGLAQSQKILAEKESRKKGSYNLWEFLKLDPAKEGEVYGGSIVLRMVTDEPDWLGTRQHSFIKTKPAPKDKPADKGWPANMGAVCRKSEGFDAIYDSCYICDAPDLRKADKNGKLRAPFAAPRMWAVAVVRKPVLGTQEQADAGQIEEYEVGEPVGYEDETIDVDVWENDEKTTKTIKKFVVLNFGMENFFDHLLGYISTEKTVLNQDFKVTRKGAGTDTKYTFAALGKTKTLVNGKETWFDLRNKTIAAEYALPFNLIDIVAEQASDEHYNWFFDKTVESSWVERYGKKDDAEAETATAEDTEAQEGATRQTIEGLRERFKTGR